jgi:DNA-binding transcriptional LysR family regulator
MELHQLETFLAVAEERSFSRAAVRLHRTQPAVSQVIRKLEAAVGETLFDRAARDGSLTASGVLLRDYALRLLALRREASSALGELKSLESGRLQLAANEYTCMYLLPAIDRYRREFPHITVAVHRMLASRIPDELNLRTFELGMLSFRPDPAHFRSIAVYADTLAFIVSPSHPLAGAKRVSISQLGEETFIAHNVASPLRRKVIEAYFSGSAGLRSVQPSFSPLFCSLSQSSNRGWKYSTIAEASALSLPVITFSASGQGFDWPIESIAFSRAPASLEP